MIASALIGIANYCIYMATIDYMVAAYGPYAASATGGNALARDFLAGVAAMYATPSKRPRPPPPPPQDSGTRLARREKLPNYLEYILTQYVKKKLNLTSPQCTQT